MCQISVITTLYNYCDYIGDAIKSFMAQNFLNSEMIIVDDCSSDNPERVINANLSDRVRYVRLKENHGYSYAKNVGIEMSRSEALVMLDADDMLTPESLSSRFKKLSSGFDFVHGPALDLKNGHFSLSGQWKKWQKCKSGVDCYRYVHAQGVMLSKDIHRKIGLYDETLRSKSDREMWARIFNHGFRIGSVSEPVSIYRQHSKQMSRSKAKLAINDALQQKVLATIARRKTDLSDVRKLT